MVTRENKVITVAVLSAFPLGYLVQEFLGGMYGLAVLFIVGIILPTIYTEFVLENVDENVAIESEH
jgi:hypothetical protein